ncbi:hypothetical protein BGX33_011292, partial [Mortierella sp. NVP41]
TREMYRYRIWSLKQSLEDVFLHNTQCCQIDSLTLEYYRQVDFFHADVLKLIPLTRLHLSRIDDDNRLCQILESIDFSRLQILSIYGCMFIKAAEAILSRRMGEFTESLVV